MFITVQLFARARELAGAGEARIELDEGVTVGGLRTALAGRFPLAELLAVSRIAVNHDFAPDSSVLQASDEVAVIPPVSGG
jgi:molybdopterin converting factor subunit 1